MADFPKSIHLLLSLNKKECKKFKDYLNSPYFNKRNQTLTKIYKLVLKEFKTNEKAYCEAELMRKVYGKLNKRRYKFDLQQMKEHVERFLALQQAEENNMQFDLITLKDYLQRANGIFFEKKHKQVKQQLAQKPKDIYYYQNLFIIEGLLDSHIIQYKDKREDDTNLQAISDAIDSDFLLKKLCYLVLMHNRKNIAKNTNYNFGFKPYVLDHFSKNSKIEDPLINLLYCAYEILTSTNKEKGLKKLNEQLLKNNQTFAVEIVNLLFTIIQNNLKHSAINQKQFHQQLFNLYNTFLNKNYIKTNGMLPVTFFKNIVSLGLELEKYNYIENFLEEYKNKLSPYEVANQAYAYNKAKLLIYKKEPDKVMELIGNIKFKDAIHTLDLKCLKIMLYYDLEEHRMLDASINTCSVALTPNRRPVVSDQNTTVYKNFINCLKKMYHYIIKKNTNKHEVEELKQYVEVTKQLYSRRWLAMRIETLLLK